MKTKLQKHICRCMLVVMCLLCVGCGQQKDSSTDLTTDKNEISVQDEESHSADQQASSSKETETAETETAETEAAEVKALEFPLSIDEGRLELVSVFEYDGPNPDFEDVFAEEIGAIQLKNISGQYLKSVNILVDLSDGTQLNFLVEDIPADVEVLAFETQNQVYDDTEKVVNISAEGTYSAEEFTELFSYSVSGSEITVENISESAQNNIIVNYHCTIDGLCFGGQSYELSLESLEAGASGTVFDTLCYMGDVTVMNIVAE